MAKKAAEKGANTWFIVHRRELVKQSVKSFNNVEVPHGVISAGFMEAKRLHVQIASIQTLAKRFDRYPKPSLIIFDECHHVAAGSWDKIYKQFPEAYFIGLTATPQRLDGTGLGKWFQRIVRGPSVAWLIENKFLVPYKMYAPGHLNLSGVHTRMGDFVNSELTNVVDRPTITGDAIKHYTKHAAGKRAVVFCVSVAHSKHVVEQFNQAGIPAVHVDGETPTEERDNSIRRFENGEVKILSNVELFGEGFDLPALEVAILLRPTQSLGLYLQQVGRALRPSPGKGHAIILDHAGNCERHGLPDEDRQWVLDSYEAPKGQGVGAGLSVRVCPKCFAAQYSGKPVCLYCGHAFPVQGREVDEKDGDLTEVDVEALRKRRRQAQGQLGTLEELIAEGKRRGYRKPEFWAKYVFNARQAEKLQGANL
jgi:superfamily II DNA or RNA helicase